MSDANEMREFLVSRRARVTPERAGLPRYGRNRRVAGLRREEVALLADISVEYYTRLERGNARGISSEVLDAVSKALQLDEAEREHLFDLARAANLETPPRRNNRPERVRPSIRGIVDAMPNIPAFVTNGRLDILYANPLAEALYLDAFRDPIQPPNSARYLFLDPRAKAFYQDWDEVAHDIAAALHGEAGRKPFDLALSDLIGLLSTRSEEFRSFWAGHDVRLHRSGIKGFHHPLVGDLVVAFESLDLPADPGLSLVTYMPREAADRAALERLAALNATRQRATTMATSAAGGRDRVRQEAPEKGA